MFCLNHEIKFKRKLCSISLSALSATFSLVCFELCVDESRWISTHQFCREANFSCIHHAFFHRVLLPFHHSMHIVTFFVQFPFHLRFSPHHVSFLTLLSINCGIFVHFFYSFQNHEFAKAFLQIQFDVNTSLVGCRSAHMNVLQEWSTRTSQSRAWKIQNAGFFPFSLQSNERKIEIDQI